MQKDAGYYPFAAGSSTVSSASSASSSSSSKTRVVVSGHTEPTSNEETPEQQARIIELAQHMAMQMLQVQQQQQAPLFGTMDIQNANLQGTGNHQSFYVGTPDQWEMPAEIELGETDDDELTDSNDAKANKQK